MRPRHVGSTAALFAALAVALPRPAHAHAFLDHADPKVGSSVAAAPAKVTLHFTQAVEAAFSTARVSDAAGKQVDLKDAAVDAKDGTVLAVSLPATLAAGTYKVEWKVTSTDTHRTHGSFTFTVQPTG